MVIDRIENKRHERNIKLFKWGTIISLLHLVIRISCGIAFVDAGFDLADLVSVFVPISMLYHYFSTSKKWGGQFFEWREKELEFKSRKYDTTTISHSSILQINIKLDIIEIQTQDSIFTINIEDYTEYMDRVRLKTNFEELKGRVG
ncbi:MAG: hypothetical protein ACJAY8_001113 [Sphingobacteriales bacterium]|jgi:hypothetical protein